MPGLDIQVLGLLSYSGKKVNMARMHSRKRGKAGSKRPLKKTKPIWLSYSPREIELLIVKLAKERKTPSQIGIFLRDIYGIPNEKVITKKSITQILEENKILSQIPEDLTALMRKRIALDKHREENKQDISALKGLQLTESKIKRLVKYYKRVKKLPVEWQYDPKKIKIHIE